MSESKPITFYVSVLSGDGRAMTTTEYPTKAAAVAALVGAASIQRVAPRQYVIRKKG